MRRLSLTPPRREGALLALLLVAAIGLVAALAAGTWAWMNGRAQAALVEAGQATVEAAAELGLRLRQVSVEGREHTRASEILAALDLPQGAPLLALDPTAARERLESLPWVKEASVERRLPDLVHVRLKERTPIALWDQGGGHFLLVDADGVAISDDLRGYADLPVISGAGAPKAAADLFTMLGGEPALARRVRAAVRVGERRWNLWIDGVGADGLEVRLPETDPARALSRLARLDEREALLARDLRVIDLRLPDRLVVRLNEDDATPRPKGLRQSGPLPLPAPGRDA